jgi:hypothetical protein
MFEGLFTGIIIGLILAYFIFCFLINEAKRRKC